MKRLIAAAFILALASPAMAHSHSSHHGGRYLFGHGSSHKGGHYMNWRTGNHYTHRT